MYIYTYITVAAPAAMQLYSWWVGLQESGPERRTKRKPYLRLVRHLAESFDNIPRVPYHRPLRHTKAIVNHTSV